MAHATFAAGCFWHVEHTFRQVPGVREVVSGYTGGHVDEPTYKQVCQGDTGHAEAVQVDYDPDQVTFDALLAVFWQCHDPTQLNRQGPDVGPQYRSAIFYHDDGQREAAERAKAAEEASGRHRHPIVTEITPASSFYRAEEYHQRFLEKNGAVPAS
jgi:peptide-methionine (S)-S-oxide reductase